MARVPSGMAGVTLSMVGVTLSMIGVTLSMIGVISSMVGVTEVELMMKVRLVRQGVRLHMIGNLGPVNTSEAIFCTHEMKSKAMMQYCMRDCILEDHQSTVPVNLGYDPLAKRSNLRAPDSLRPPYGSPQISRISSGVC